MANTIRKSHLFVWGLTLTTAGLCALVVQTRPAARTVFSHRDGPVSQTVGRPAAAARSGAAPRIAETYGRLPLSFEANRGQTAAQVKFLARGSGYNLFLTSTETVLALQQPERHQRADTKEAAPFGGVIRMRLLGGRPDAPVAGRDELPGRVSYFRGNDPAEWRTGIPTYAKVAYEDVYPGTDLVYYGNNQQLEYDFVVSPGADPHAIRLGFDGADRLDIDAHGDLVLHTASGTLRQRKPVIYQAVNGVRREVTGGYLIAEGVVTFHLGDYDRTLPLVIDPILVYSTFVGGANTDQDLGIAVDAVGDAYVTGQTLSADFPTTPAGAFDTTLGGTTDAFVMKLHATGSALVYSTYLGGSGGEAGRSIAVDAAGNAYVTGETSSTNFPTTAGAFDTSANGLGDAFVTKLNAAGTALVYSTYLGGGGPDFGFGIAVDGVGAAYVTGQTSKTFFQTAFPTTAGAFDTTFNGGVDAFATKLNAAGTALAYSTFLGDLGLDAGLGIAVDSVGTAYVTGLTTSAKFPTTVDAFDTTFNGAIDAFVTALNGAGSALVYSTYLGGSGSETGRRIAVDAAGNAYVTGQTASMNFPTTSGAFDTTPNGLNDAFVTNLNAAGTALVYSTYLGGSGNDLAFGIALDTAGNAYVTGQTFSGDFPTAPGAFDTTLNGSSDAFATRLNAVGSALDDSTFLGGSGDDRAHAIALDAAGSRYLTGLTASGDFPTTPEAFSTTSNGGVDAFITKFGPPAADLAITKADSPDPVVTGTDLTYTLTVTNKGPDAAVDVTVTDTLPAETTFVSCSATGGGVCGGAGNNRTVTFATLASGATETVTLVATVCCSVADGAPINNTASVSAATMDPDASNNMDMETTTASNPAPTISGAAVDKPTLWPPNHQMVDVTVSYGVSDNCPQPANACTLSVSSNEPDNEAGDGDTTSDWEIVDATHVRLRAERAGAGTGRLYTITITCTDSGGATSTQTVTVSVPKSQKP